LKRLFLATLATVLGVVPARAEIILTRADCTDRVQAVCTGQIIAVLMALKFEHATASVIGIGHLPVKWQGKVATFAPVDESLADLTRC